MGNPQLSALDLRSVSFQNFEDDGNIDAYNGVVMWTRPPSLGWQSWNVTKIGTFDGEDVFTITMTDPTAPNLKGKNLEATQPQGTLTLADAEPNKLAQRWLLRFQDDQTVILSIKFRDLALTATGIDNPIILDRVNTGGSDAQMWMPYNKDARSTVNSDSRRRSGANA
ncbi:MAG TPA: hypothetical protein VFX16_23225 [Pseudonocardiaceae bacterium]|nr:hypothetical protein [Pseudonocardiaceae bacterium]